MEWCCTRIRNAFLEAGERGIGFFVDSSTFILQFRAVAAGVVPPDPGESLITLVEDSVIHYCPWCGTRLDRFYRKHLESLEKPGLRIEI